MPGNSRGYPKGMLDSVQEVIDSAQAGKVFGEPIERDGMTVLPVAKVRGGGGTGGPRGAMHEGEEAGGVGMGMMAKPLGVFVIKQGRVRWQPAIDLNRAIIGGQIVAALGLLTIRTYLKRRKHH